MKPYITPAILFVIAVQLGVIVYQLDDLKPVTYEEWQDTFWDNNGETMGRIPVVIVQGTPGSQNIHFDIPVRVENTVEVEGKVEVEGTVTTKEW